MIKPKIATLLLLMSLWIWLPKANAAIPNSEREALIALYNATGGANWTNNSGWLGAVGTECGWYRVSCTNDHVSSLDLGVNQLSGSIPTQLGQLSQLQYLSLSNNQLSGAIPSELGQLSQLQTLYLSGNQLSGSIPIELGQLNQLQYLDLRENQLSGAIPAEFGQLSQLKALYLPNNQLSSLIPVQLGQLSQLQGLDLRYNQLSGTIPTQLGQLTQLQGLDLRYNQLNGAIPAELGQLSQIEALWLSGNQLSGTIPAELGQLSQLNVLWFSGNQLSGAIPTELGQLSQLKELYLDGNQLNGTIPAELGQLNQLHRLGLAVNLLSGAIPNELSQLSQLQYLNLEWNQLTKVPLQIVQLSGLFGFAVYRNCINPATLDAEVIAFLNQKDPYWQQQNAACPVIPATPPPKITEGIIPDTGLHFEVTLTNPLPDGYGVFLDFDNQQGTWLLQSEAGGHLPLLAQGNNVFATDYVLAHPGIRSVRAGIFYLNGDSDPSNDTLVGSYSAPATCTLPSCLEAIVRPDSIGDPAITGSGSELFKNVDVANGNYHLAATDISVDGKGPAFAFSRAYNSLALKPWSFGYEAKASFLSGTYNRQIAIGPREDGHIQYFYKDMDDLWYTLNPGNFEQLVENPDGSLVLYSQGNRLYRFASPLAAADGRLLSIEDRLGNALTFSYNAGNKLTGATDANGRAYTISRDPNNRIQRVTDFTGRYVEYGYDSNGMLISVRNLRGNSQQYSYVGTLGDDRFRLADIIDPRGNLQMSIDYAPVTFTISGKTDTQNRVVTLTDGLNNSTEIAYPYIDVSPRFANTEATTITQPTVDSVNNNVAFLLDRKRTRVDKRLDTINAPAYVKSRYYNVVQDRQHLAESSLVNQTVDPKDAATSITYDTIARNRPNVITDALNGTHLASYNSVANQQNLMALTLSQQPGGAITQFQNHTPTGLAATIIDPLNNTTNRTFDPQNNYWLTQATNPRGNSTIYAYDEFGHVTSTIEPLNRQSSRSYDALGRVSEEISPSGLHTLYSYDEHGNVLSKIQQATGINYSSYSGYDESDNLLWSIDPRGHRTDYYYDALNRKIEERYRVAGELHSRLYSYDALGRLRSVTNERGHTSTTHYDTRNQVTEKINPHSETTRYRYDANGNVASVTDSAGRTLTYSYDALNRKTQQLDANGNTQTWSYHPNGQVASHTDGRGKVSFYVYDVAGRLIQTTEAGLVSSASYDANGNVHTVTDANGYNSTRYEYDELDRRISTMMHGGETWRYKYDIAGNLTMEITPTGEKTLQNFDALGRLIQRSEYGDFKVNNQLTRQINYSYDANSNVTSISQGGNTVSYTYDALNRISSVTDQYGQTLSYAYDKVGNRTRLTYPGNKTVNYAYDNADRLLSLTDWLNHTTNYSRNAAGQISEVVNGNGSKSQYGYDAAGRLIQLKNLQANGSVISSHDLTLDGAGNITQAEVTLPLLPILPASVSNLIYADNNHLVEAGSTSYSRDTSGRIVQITANGNGTQTIYNFDINDHISSISQGSTTLSRYGYDLNDNRISQTQNGTETRYVIDSLSALPNVVAETSAQGGILRYYIYGEGLVSQIDAGGNSHYYHFDPTGHTLALTDANGSITDKYAYTPYGHTTSQGSTPNPFKFVGKHGVMDDGNGLHYMRARYYKEDIMRFMSLDALHGDMLTPQALNRYAYVQGNPVNLIDPSGNLFCFLFFTCEEEKKADVIDKIETTINDAKKIAEVGQIIQDTFEKQKGEYYLLSVINDGLNEIDDILNDYKEAKDIKNKFDDLIKYSEKVKNNQNADGLILLRAFENFNEYLPDEIKNHIIGLNLVSQGTFTDSAAVNWNSFEGITGYGAYQDLCAKGNKDACDLIIH